MNKHALLLSAFAFSSISLFSQPSGKPPEWAKQAIWYQIMVERFANGDSKNDPTAESITIAPVNDFPPSDWKITPWSQDWYQLDDYAKNANMDFKRNAIFRRYGGDLKGVFDKLDYLQKLGITAIYFNPLNHAPSLHKYDASYYHHIDAHFGPDAEGDKSIMEKENHANSELWKWTQADLLFLELVKELHKRDIKVIVDFSWNHTGTLFWAWQDILKNQANSKFKDWYDIESFDNQKTPENEFKYKGWIGINTLPEFKKVNVKGNRKTGFPYAGNLHPSVKQHIFDVTKRWLAPNGIVADGIDGIRLDVADQIGLDFWREYRTFVKSVKPDAYIVGEIWWQEWPDQLMNPADYCQGDMFDAVMHYQIYRPARYFFAETNFKIDAKQLKDSMQFHLSRLKPENQQVQMNVAASHDTPRLLTCFANPNKYKYQATPFDQPDYQIDKPNAEVFKRVELYRIFQFTMLGAPHIWNGDEMGMTGADDPDCRKPLWWPEYKMDLEKTHPKRAGEFTINQPMFDQESFDKLKKLIEIRKSNPELSQGALTFLQAQGDLLIYKRTFERDEIWVAFNLSEQPIQFDLPINQSYEDLMTNQVFNNTVELKSLSALILKLK